MSELSKKSPTTTSGTRASGTPGFDASADYVVRKLRQAGYKVKRQTFTFPFFRDVAPPELSEVSPTDRDHRDCDLHLLGQRRHHRPAGSDDDIVIPPTPEPSSSFRLRS